MNGWKRIYNFMTKNSFKRMSLKAIAYSGVFRIQILCVPMSILKKRFGIPGEESTKNISRDNYKYAAQVGMVVERMLNKTPWESKCLVKALTAQKLLKKRKIPTTLYLGVGKEDGKMIAHAWLRCGEFFVTGGKECSRYAVVAQFRSCE